MSAICPGQTPVLPCKRTSQQNPPIRSRGDVQPHRVALFAVHIFALINSEREFGVEFAGYSTQFRREKNRDGKNLPVSYFDERILWE
jgi:hypothetical protein